MNHSTRLTIIIAYAFATSSMVGVISLALHLSVVWPGMVVSLVGGMVQGFLWTRGKAGPR